MEAGVRNFFFMISGIFDGTIRSQNTLKSEYLLMLLIQLGAEGFTTCRGAMDFSVSILRDTLGKELPYASDDMREGRNCQQKSCGTV